MKYTITSMKYTIDKVVSYKCIQFPQKAIKQNKYIITENRAKKKLKKDR